jgi:hypothetical protein
MKKFFPVMPRDKASSNSESNKVIDFEILETDPSRRPAIEHLLCNLDATTSFNIASC